MAKQLVRSPPSVAYEDDFYGWCLEQALLLRTGRLDAVDMQNVAEELEALGNEQASALRSSYRILLLHLLKWRYQPKRRTRSWAGTIVRERVNAPERLADNPGLKQHQRRLFVEAYGGARKQAAVETGLPLTTFPVECPFTLDQALDDDFWPDAA